MDRTHSVHALHHIQHAALHQVRVDDWLAALAILLVVDESLAFRQGPEEFTYSEFMHRWTINPTKNPAQDKHSLL